jgi:hypothetical protein
LDFGYDTSLNTLAWDAVEQKPRLPARMKDFFERRGLMPVHSECRRAYRRFYLRGEAILRRQDTILGVYTTDASRKGIRFLSPVQLLPKERGRIRLPNTKEFQVEIVRCLRIDESCYECGAIFIVGT